MDDEKDVTQDMPPLKGLAFTPMLSQRLRAGLSNFGPSALDDSNEQVADAVTSAAKAGHSSSSTAGLKACSTLRERQHFRPSSTFDLLTSNSGDVAVLRLYVRILRARSVNLRVLETG